MKKLLLLAATIFSISLFNLRADEVNYGNGHIDVTLGSLAILNEKVPARLILDCDSTRVVEFGRRDEVKEDHGDINEYMKSKGEDWVADWEEMQINVRQYCEEKFTKRKKMYIDDENPLYEVRIVVEQLDFGDVTARVFSGFHEEGGVEFSGKVIITEIATGMAVCKVNVVWMKGLNGISYNVSQLYGMRFTFGDIFLNKFLFRQANRAR